MKTKTLIVLSESIVINGLPQNYIGPFESIRAAQVWADSWEITEGKTLPPGKIDVMLFIPDE